MDMNYFAGRRTRRHFTDRRVDDALLQKIVADASHAPNTGNMQTYSIVASRKGEGRKALEGFHFNQPAAVEADVLLTVCADFNLFSRWCRLSGAEPCYDNFMSFSSAMTDAVILAQQIVTVAELNGLGSCYLGTVTYNPGEISQLLGLPELVVPVACVALGYPADGGVEAERLGTPAFLFNEKYPELTDAQILENYRVKDEYPDNARFVAENGKESLAQVFTDVRYTRAMMEGSSEKLLAAIRRAGFLK